MVRAWRTVRREYLAAHGKGSLDFIAVFEATKRGWPHLHIVARAGWIDQRWLSKRMAALIGSPIVDVRRVDGVGKVAHYVAKYLGKNPHRFEGVKRYWRSLKYLSPVDDQEPLNPGVPPVWIVEMRHWTCIAMDAAEIGFHVVFGRDSATYSSGEPP